MPKIFKLTEGLYEFKCKLESHQCVGFVRGGAQCKRRVVIGLPFCFAHTRMYLHLTVHDSTIPEAGKGVFAYDKSDNRVLVFEKGEYVCQYWGERISKEELEQRYPGNITAPYGIEIGDTNTFMDGACVRGLGTLVNHEANKRRANAELRDEFIDGEYLVIIRARKRIYNGDEILVHYGTEYEFQNNHSTK